MKKIISIILCLVIVLSMAVSAFAATDNTTGTITPAGPNGPIRPVGPNNPNQRPTDTPNNPPRRETEIIHIDLTEEEPEENPSTGAPVFAVPAVIAVVAAATVIGKRK